MKNVLVVLYGVAKPMENDLPPSFKDILFTSPLDWLELTFKHASLGKVLLVAPYYIESSFNHVSPAKLIKTIAESDAEDILLLSADRPLITTSIIKDAYKNYKKRGRRSTLISDSDNNTSGIGWYDKSVVTSLLSEDIVSLADFYQKLKKLKVDYTKHYYPAEFLLCSSTTKGYNRLSTIARNLVIDRLLDAGVNIPIVDGIIISPCSVIGAGTTILPGTIIKNASIIEEGCEIGPNSYIDASKIKAGAKIISSYIEKSTVGSATVIGPMSRLRPNSVVGENVKIGNFVEIKNTNIGEGTSVAHLSYVGDSDVGANCNFGCGVATVNYDGSNKHRTTVGDNVFIGCNCSLIAPVTLEDGAYTAAGTVVTENVPKDSLVIGRVRQSIKENWREKKGLFSKE